MTENIRVSALFIHPLKSGAGIAVNEFVLDALGAVNDRRWMLIDEHGVFMTQRENGALALIHPTVKQDGLLLQHAKLPPLEVAFPTADAPAFTTIVWSDQAQVRDAGDVAAAWCSAAIGVRCRLVHIAESSARPLARKYAGSVNPDGRTVALSDGAPLLVLGEGSISALNAKLVAKGSSPLGVNRFRPNVLLAGTKPHDEDQWLTIRIGDVTIGVGSQCLRCVMTTIDQELGRRAPSVDGEPGGEPLRTLATYRRQGSGVTFGMNATHAALGTLRVGDAVEIIERRPA